MVMAPREVHKVLELKGGLQPLTELKIYLDDMTRLESQLAAKVAQAPGFFAGAPVVIDLEPLGMSGPSFALAKLVTVLRKHGLVPVAVRGGNGIIEHLAIENNLGVLPSRRQAVAQEVIEQPATPSAARVIRQPVRSGQQIYVRGGDLVILAPVSPGAEVLADGHIHVYAPLRGRALAGAQGDVEARIFCHALEAELISIAGCYKIAEDIDPGLRGQAVQIFLEGESLVMQPWSRLA